MSSSSRHNELLAREWLDRCRKTHERCRSDIIQPGVIPTRLLEINFTNYTPTVRIVETSGQSREGRSYIALSYCWGNAEFPTLRSDNEKQFKNEILFSTLPKTFQDAIQIARWFRIHYIWIDSLCILQDSQDDWAEESCRMKNVYRNSFLTIAATGAINPSIGCFQDRKPELIEPLRFRALDRTNIVFDVSIWTTAMNDSPLSKRGWAFQERMLSPRVLHFGETQMLWQCAELSACESCPGGFYDDRLSVSSAPKLALGLLPNRENLDFFEDIWEPIVQSYTRSNLTRFSDKSLAISGIADEVQSSSGRSYAAGLWREDFERQLLWKVNHDQRDSLDSCVRPYVAPSWSWLSVDGPIAYHHTGDRQKVFHLEVIDLKLELSNKSIFGPFKSGYIRARGMLLPATLQPIGNKEGDVPGWEPRSIRHRLFEDSDDNTPVWLDTATETERNVFWVLVWSTGRELSGLLLASTGAKPDEYRRIGIFYLDANYFRFPWLLERMRKNEITRKRTKTTFTIV